MADEEIIKKRLLIDGDGTGDDRRLNMILKQFLKWTLNKNETPENSQIIFDRLLAQLAQCEFAASKSEFTLKMIEDELGNYAKLSEMIDKSIDIAKQDIEDTKKELVIAKEVRRNKMEYDLLAKKIKEQPDRRDTNRKIDTIQKELDKLIVKKVLMERKLQKRRNDLTLLMYCLGELQSQVNENDGDSFKSDNEEIVEGAMELSDDEDLQPIQSNTSISSLQLWKKLDSDVKSEATSDSTGKELNLVEEDAVLELSIENDEKDIKIEMTDVSS